MTTPKEALERIIQIYERNAGRQNEKLADIPLVARRALASLQGEDAVERVARIIVGPRLAVPDNCQFTLEELRSVRWSQSTKAEQQDALNAARAILATGLVAGEAEIRADIGSRSWGNDVIDTLSERKLTCRQLAEYIWHRAHKEPMCFEQNIARLIENERKQAADRARADEREKCAKVAERKFAGTLTSNIGLRIAAAIRSGGGE